MNDKLQILHLLFNFTSGARERTNGLFGAHSSLEPSGATRASRTSGTYLHVTRLALRIHSQHNSALSYLSMWPYKVSPSLSLSLSPGPRLYYLPLYYTTPTFRPAPSTWGDIVNANELFAWDWCGQLRGWAGVSDAAAALPARMGSARVLTIHGHTFENEIFLFSSQSRFGKSILFYITVLLELRIGSLRLNEFHLPAVAGCRFFFFFPRPPTQSNITFSFRCRFSRLQHLNSRCSCAGIGSFIIGGSP